MEALTAPLILHVDGHWNSPYAFSAFVSLTEKKLPFQTREVNLHEHAQKTPAFQATSLTGRVPVLEHGSFHLSESSAIVEYLEEIFPPPAYAAMLPSDSRERARARQVMAWIRSDLMPIRDERPTSTIFYERAKEPLTAAGRVAAQKLIHVATTLIPEGRTSLFENFTIADADLAMMLQRLIANRENVPAKLRNFAAAQWERPSVQAFANHPRPPFVPY